MEYDFGGYVTKNDTMCADGRTIRKGAFKAQNGMKVPLVWMHQRNEPENVLGHAILENRDDGVYGYCKFNNSPRGKQAKLLVEHGDISSMSIFANDLVQKGGNVTHGKILEVSLVIAPANPGALIDNPVIQHGEEEYEDLTKATITSGCDIELGVEYTVEHAADTNSKWKKKKPQAVDDDPDDDSDGVDDPDDMDDDSDIDEPDDEDNEEEDEEVDPKKKRQSMEHADDPETKKKGGSDSEDDDETVEDVYNTLTDKQKKVVAYIIGVALSEQEKDDEAEQSDEEGEDFMEHRNVFDQNDGVYSTAPTLSHDQMTCIMQDAEKCGSLKQSFLAHAQEYGIENIDVLFPDAKTVGDNPYLIKRPTEWVSGVLNETTHVPFSRIKSTAADLTADEARAKGYVKGNKKKEEIIPLLKRVTSPTTVYKKQKLDRDDIVDITDINVVAWLKAEMRVMLDEELARAYLVGDGREVDDEDKIDESCIRPIWKDDDMYAHHVILPSTVSDEEIPEEILKAQEEYKGSGNPSLYSTSGTVLNMLLLKDKIGRRLYNTEAELSSAIGVSKIVKVPVMERQFRTTTDGKKLELLAIIVNLRDYTVGATNGGQISMFDDFDIDFNQYKYLIETRISGALIKPFSAMTFALKKTTSAG